MKNLKTIFAWILLLMISFACKKVKLENDERGVLLIDQWKFQYAGKFNQSGTFLNYSGVVYPYQNYILEFKEGGELATYGVNSSNSYNITHTAPQDYNDSQYGYWFQSYHYENNEESGYLTVRYYGDSIIVSALPYDMYTPYNNHGGNVFYRVE